MSGAAPRPAESTFFKSNLTLNLKTGGFITAEGMHFFSMFHKTPAEGANWRVMSRGGEIPPVIVDDRTADVLAKLLYWERTQCEESYNWVPLTKKFAKDGMNPVAGVLGVEVNEKCRHLFETETMEADVENAVEVKVVEEEEQEGVVVHQSPLASVTRKPNNSPDTAAANPQSESAVALEKDAVDDLTEQLEKIQTEH